MKFGKTYMETLASPSFPEEWRKGAIEYKHLKKLINGVVAELESLGLGADVLKELMVPAGEGEDQDTAHTPARPTPSGAKSSRPRPSSGSHELSSSEEHEHSEESGSNTSSREIRRGRHSQPGHAANPELSPLLEDREHVSRTAAASSSISAKMAEDEVNFSKLPDGASPAQQWISSIAPSRSRSRRRSSRNSHSGGEGERSSSRGPVSDATSRSRSGSEAAVDDAEGPEIEIMRPSLLLPPHASRLPESVAARRSLSASRDASGASSADEASGRPHYGIGKKDLEAMRRRSSAASSGSDHHEAAPAPKAGSSSSERAARRQPEPTANEEHDWNASAWRERGGTLWTDELLKNSKQPTAQAPGGGLRGRWVNGQGGRRARAEYELGGTPEHPLPRIRLFVESPVNSDEEDAVHNGDADSEGSDAEDEAAQISEIPDSPRSLGTPRLGKKGTRSPRSPRTPRDGSSRRGSKGGDEPAPPPMTPLPPPEIHRNGVPSDSPDYPHGSDRRVRTREIIIPLTADTEFLDTLTGALSNLNHIQGEQRDHFIADTESLSNSVARVASPFATKSDLYVWREIFGLWVEMQIFESEREKDRGELSVDESEARLKRFAEELAKRGWTADAIAAHSAEKKKGKGLGRLVRRKNESTAGLPMKDPRSIEALEDFLRLNIALLDVKKFQRVNVEAARKILKKHDKRTALTASSDLRAFMAQEAEARRRATTAAQQFSLSGLADVGHQDHHFALIPAAGKDAHPSLAALIPTSTTGLLAESLPHILLSLLTTTLLPILPSIDDYSCAICTSVAWRPVKLDCQHLFCIRCLVKLQKQGKMDCPMCRAKGAVGTADERNLEEATDKFLKTWFPKEVAEKEKENDRDRREEELKELGIRIDDDGCVVC